jgi:hypothetical protein
MNPIAQRQFEHLREVRPRATIEWRPDGTAFVTVPELELAAGKWNKRSTTVRFVVPLGYPAAKPDSFWVDPDVRLATGLMPQNTAINTSHGGPAPLLWFSWHTISWNPNSDSLKTYLSVIDKRLQQGL